MSATLDTLAPEATDPDVLTAADERRLLAGAPWRRVAILGDSVAAGVGDPVPGYDTLGWADRIARALDRATPGVRVRNLGRRNLRAADVRAQQIIPALMFSPDLAIVVCGGNDMLARDFDPAAVEHELGAIVAALRGGGADVLLATLVDITRAIPYPDPFPDRIAALRDATLAVARRQGALVADLGAHPRSADPSIYSADGLHANMIGHAVAASAGIAALA
jgi:lysophospholipase L1-like esterase